jgi:hypothetical protein
VSEAQVTVGYLARRASTSGGHWDTGGGGGELRGGVVGRSAVGVADIGGEGGAVAKTGSGLGCGNKTRDALQSIEILWRERKSKPRMGCETFACKKL